MRTKVGFLGGVMNLGGNVGGISVPVTVGIIVHSPALISSH
jgi:ACS family D-galactonate transporter-like MFS transporter